MTKDAIYHRVRTAVARGVITKTACETCGNPKVDAHHRWGYDNPLRVVWLCRLHHKHEHHGDKAGRAIRDAAIMARLDGAEPPTQVTLAREYGLTKARVSQIVAAARAVR